MATSSDSPTPISDEMRRKALGDPPERYRINFRLNVELLEQLRREADARMMSMNILLEQILEKGLAELPPVR